MTNIWHIVFLVAALALFAGLATAPLYRDHPANRPTKEDEE